MMYLGRAAARAENKTAIEKCCRGAPAAQIMFALTVCLSVTRATSAWASQPPPAPPPGPYFSNTVAVSSGSFEPGPTISERVDSVFVPAVDVLSSVIFWDPFAAAGLYDPQIRDEHGKVLIDEGGSPVRRRIPLVVAWLMLGGIFFTLTYRFINIRGFAHGVSLMFGRHSRASEPGDVSHFQALATALSATVGLGNIAGVAVAISAGGPGAALWLAVAGILGMSSKFTECALGSKYRVIDPHGRVAGGPMYYLSAGLANKGFGRLGKVLATSFATLCIAGSFGGANMFQSNQTLLQLSTVLPSAAEHGLLVGLVIAFLVGLVIVGDVRSLARVTSVITPVMCGVYVSMALAVLIIKADALPAAIVTIFSEAFNAQALRGGFLGVLIIGFQRAAFSNEAGVGSAAIAHSAARTKEPIREGFVALIEPFVDTVVVCSITATVIVVTGAYHNQGLSGTALSSEAFGSVVGWFPYVLSVTVCLFAYSTMISWSYYGLKAWCYLVGWGRKREAFYKALFLSFTVLGCTVSMGAVVDFSDMMVLGMAFPNMIGLLLMSSEVRADLSDYWRRLREGQLRVPAEPTAVSAPMGRGYSGAH